MTRDQFIDTLNTWGAARIPFFFLIDFEFEKPLALRMDSIDPSELAYDIAGVTNVPPCSLQVSPRLKTKYPVPFQAYQEQFRLVHERLLYGDSYLTNLTIKTEVEIEGTFFELFHGTQALYKLKYKDEFMVFSPECFVRTANNRIYSYPMKGTIDATIPDAEKIILQDPKELAEHVTIVDLIRNDLSRIAEDVKVDRFRYIDRIRTHQKDLLQVSSEVSGELPLDFHRHLGNTIASLLPAGSVSGAPKTKTVQIIASAEREARGYYTGIFGYFNGKDLDSAVIIRYIERREGKYFYRSGGGITAQSRPIQEYQEAIDKIYLPLKV